MDASKYVDSTFNEADRSAHCVREARLILWGHFLEQNPYCGSGTVIERALIACPVTLVKVRHCQPYIHSDGADNPQPALFD